MQQTSYQRNNVSSKILNCGPHEYKLSHSREEKQKIIPPSPQKKQQKTLKYQNQSN